MSMTPEQKKARLPAIAKVAKKMKTSSVMRRRMKEFWARRHQAAQQLDEEPKDTTIETAGSADYDLQELPDLITE